MAVSALAHGVFQGGMTAATGGKFWAGFAAGAVSSIAASFWQGGQEEGFFKENNWAYGVKNVHEGLGSILGMNNAFGTIVFGTVMGGGASALAGGNFWQGAVTGMIVSTFNHEMHGDNDDEIQVNSKTKKVTIIEDGSSTDNVYVDGKWNLSAKHGVYNAKYYKNIGFKVSELYSVGMSFTDLTLDTVNLIDGAVMIKMGLTKVLKSAVGFRRGFGASKETLESSVYFTKLFGFKPLPVSRLPTLYGPAKDWGTFLGRNAPILGGVQMSGGAYGFYNSTSN